ncbi:hypothetical protein IPL85_04330 [Candidatus Saccharibacteria bacterium]|nr:MAG: hypothetical protein IPL85_04330 [Candidatus Saccharibacteria bacterium]
MKSVQMRALDALKARHREQFPNNAWRFENALNQSALRNPEDRSGLFYATVALPMDSDPYAACDIRVNFPRERLKNGQGYATTAYRRVETREVDGNVFDSRKHTLTLMYGLGNLVVPSLVCLQSTLQVATEIPGDAEETLPTLRYIPHEDEITRVLSGFGMLPQGE